MLIIFESLFIPFGDLQAWYTSVTLIASAICHSSYVEFYALLLVFIFTVCLMAYLASTGIESPEQRWDSRIRQVAFQLQDAIQGTADYVFRNMKFMGRWDTSQALIWSTTCQLPAPSKTTHNSFPIQLKMYNKGGQWKISPYNLEAFLDSGSGLWLI